jgi:hypothetical protein
MNKTTLDPWRIVKYIPKVTVMNSPCSLKNTDQKNQKNEPPLSAPVDLKLTE